jgi:hypothetical protein
VHSYRIAAACSLLGGCIFAASCKTEKPHPKPGETIYVDYALNDPRVRVVPGKLEQPVAPKVDEEEPYQSEIESYLDQGDFDRLDEEAHQARVGKTRFTGGAWKLYSLYFAVTTLPEEEPVDDSNWNLRLDKLKAWVTANPESVTAQIALADAYVNYGWYVRGTGYANTVAPGQWELFEQRAMLARAILEKASQLSEKCPYWYEAMQHVAQAQGWKKSEARELMEQAVSSEPGYYYFYREYARYLDPRWYGGDGEVEAFADEISSRVGGKEGAFLYFEIASLLTCQCGSSPTHMKKLSWPKIQEGYEALDQLYGVSSLKRNRFANMAYLAADRAVTQKVLLQIGDDWDEQTWASKDHFEDVREWAVGPRPSPGDEEPSDSIVYVNSTPKTGTVLQVGNQVSLSLTVQYSLATADAGRITLVLQKDNGSELWPARRQVVAAISRGAGEATLTDAFEVPPGTKKIHAFVPLVPRGNTLGPGGLTFEYPVTQK